MSRFYAIRRRRPSVPLPFREVKPRRVVLPLEPDTHEPIRHPTHPGRWHLPPAPHDPRLPIIMGRAEPSALFSFTKKPPLGRFKCLVENIERLGKLCWL